PSPNRQPDRLSGDSGRGGKPRLDLARVIPDRSSRSTPTRCSVETPPPGSPGMADSSSIADRSCSAQSERRHGTPHLLLVCGGGPRLVSGRDAADGGTLEFDLLPHPSQPRVHSRLATRPR